MARYGEEFNGVGMNQQRDLVLSINEFCFLQNKTNGSIRSHVGPLTTLKRQDSYLSLLQKVGMLCLKTQLKMVYIQKQVRQTTAQHQLKLEQK